MSRSAVTVALLVAFGVCLRAAGDDLSVARAALRDGLWDIARVHAGTSTNDECRLVVLESYAGEGRWRDVDKILKEWPDARGAGFDYYRAVLNGDHAAAMKILKAGGSPEGLVEARLFEAEALARTNRCEEATAIWRELASQTNLSDRALARTGIGLMDVEVLRRAYAATRLSVALRRRTGLCLGRALLKTAATSAEGFKLIRAIVDDSPDAEGAREAFWAMIEAELAASRWSSAEALLREHLEIWPESARLAVVQESRGWVAQKLGKRDEALAAFRRAAEVAKTDEERAMAELKTGDMLAEFGRNDEAMVKYRSVLDRFASTKVAVRLKTVIAIRERESAGRNLYRDFKFEEARQAFEDVARQDPSRSDRMAYYRVLCLYGQGLDDEAARQAARLTVDALDVAVRQEVTLWLAKFHYNRRDWKEAIRLFVNYADGAVAGQVPEALLWAARAALADNDPASSIQLATRLAERFPESPVRPQALLVQAEALVESARFDEAVLVLERVMVSESVSSEVRLRAQMLKADALYMLGADNTSCYAAALEAYRALRLGGALSASGEVVVSFKIARTLEKLKRMDEAVDQYYAQVVLAYRDARQRRIRFDDDARAAFSKAAFRLADEFESRGRDGQALAVLDLVATSDVPAAAEARRRIGRISMKGRFL